MARALRLSIVCHGETTSSRTAGFPADNPLAVGEAKKVFKLVPYVKGANTICAPEKRSRQTAEALGLAYSIEPNFRDLDYGRWSGRTVSEVDAETPADLAQWTADADAAPHGGESISQLIGRMSEWMAANIAMGGHHIIITHPAVIRAMLIVTLQAPPSSFWRIDVEHLSITDLRSDGRRWAIRSFGKPR